MSLREGLGFSGLRPLRNFHIVGAWPRIRVRPLLSLHSDRVASLLLIRLNLLVLAGSGGAGRLSDGIIKLGLAEGQGETLAAGALARA